MTREHGRRLLVVLLVLLALPGLFMLAVDLLRASPETVAERAAEWHPLVEEASTRFGVDPALVTAVIAAESKGEVEATSDAGALGLMQLMPATAREVAADLGLEPPADTGFLDPATNITLGTAYLRLQLDAFGGDVRLALAAYNAGPTRVRGWIRSYPGLPSEEVLRRAAFSETQSYVANVLMYRELVTGRKGTHE